MVRVPIEGKKVLQEWETWCGEGSFTTPLRPSLLRYWVESLDNATSGNWADNKKTFELTGKKKKKKYWYVIVEILRGIFL